MKKILISSLIMLGLTLTIHAFDENIKPLAEKMIQKLDRQMTKHHAKRRYFRTRQEFNELHRNVHTSPHVALSTVKRVHHLTERYANGRHYNYANTAMETHPHLPLIRQDGYLHPKRGWVLAYRYDRASFYDNEGFFYGYFNRFGYYFENEFYRYDRYYTYRDRLRGQGLFDNKYYMPANASYYGLCKTHPHAPKLYQNTYERGSYTRY